MTQLLVEHLQPEVAALVLEEDASSATPSLWISGIFMEATLKNQNQRIYPVHEIARAVKEANERIKLTNGILGELDHPSHLQIGLDRVSHVITELKMQGDKVIGRAKILEGAHGTPMGNIAGAIVRAGYRLGVSSRGAGSVNESTGEVSDFTLLTCDIVANPSAPNAYPKAVMEALEHARNVNAVLDLSEQIKHDQAAQKYFREEIRKAMDELVMKGLIAARKK